MNQRNPLNNSKEDPLFLYWRVIKKWRKFIMIFVSTAVALTLIISLFMTNIYGARAIIIPVVPKDSTGSGLASSLMQQVGGLPGIAVPESTSSAEIITLLKSTTLREEIIKRNDLLPLLFPDEWDNSKKMWRINSGFTLSPGVIWEKVLRMIKPVDKTASAKQYGVPDIWDGLRELDDTVSIISNTKDKIITIYAETADPEVAANLVTCFLSALNEHMSSEAKRVALINRNYLEKQLVQTADPYIKQKIYNMIAQQIETSMMAEVKENFAFKILERPKVSDKKIKPRRFFMVMISLVAAVLLSLFFVFFMEYLEKVNKKNQ